MAITLRSTKGSALTYAEMDANFAEIETRTTETTTSDQYNYIQPECGVDLISTSTAAIKTSKRTGTVAIHCSESANSAALGSSLLFSRSRYSGSTIIPPNSGDYCGGIQFAAWDGVSAARVVGEIKSYAGETTSPTTAAGYLTLSTTPASSVTPVERMRFYSNGDILNTSTGLLGYGTGSGGAVTQGTSRTTGVTLSKSNGAITLVSAAGSTDWQTFTVTNTLVSATDVIIVNQKSGTDLNEIHVTAVAAGSFNITFRTTGGTTTEQPVFNFAVINAATS